MVKRVPILRDALVDEVTDATTHVYSPGMNFGHKSKLGLYTMASGAAIHLKLAFDVSSGTAYEVVMEAYESGDKLQITLRNDLKGRVKEVFGVWDTVAGGATNLYSSYDSTTNVIALSSALTENYGYVLYTKENASYQQKLGAISLTDVNLVDLATVALTNANGVGVVTEVGSTWRVNEWVGSYFVVSEPTDTTSGQWGKVVSNTATVLTLDRPFSVTGSGKMGAIRSPLHGWGTVPMTASADVIKAAWTPTANIWNWQDLTALVPTHIGWRLRVEGITDNGADTLVSADVVVADSVEF